MLRELAPLYPYMRRYKWAYVRGILACVCTNLVAVQFPHVLGMAIDALGKGVTRHLILLYAGLSSPSRSPRASFSTASAGF